MQVTSPIPIHALFDENGTGPNPGANPSTVIRDASVIVGVDVMSGREFLVFGRQALEAASNSDKPIDMAVLKVALDQETDELERLLALVHVIKGQHDYRS
jgi:hypothetical protein